jgi:hypothetical protein
VSPSPTESGAQAAIAMANRTIDRWSSGIKVRNRQQLSLVLASWALASDAECASIFRSLQQEGAP